MGQQFWRTGHMKDVLAILGAGLSSSFLRFRTCHCNERSARLWASVLECSGKRNGQAKASGQHTKPQVAAATQMGDDQSAILAASVVDIPHFPTFKGRVSNSNRTGQKTCEVGTNRIIAIVVYANRAEALTINAWVDWIVCARENGTR